MKATGIVRRIDDLGRVVIPKEIRRTMRIREGDPLEIFTGTGGEVIFKKYSVIGEMGDFVGTLAEAVSKNTEFCVLICDRDHCIAAAGLSKKEVLGRRVTPEVEELMTERRAAKFDDEIGFTALEGFKRTVKFAVPVIGAGDVGGIVILLESDNNAELSESDMKLISAAADFLSRQSE